MNEKIKQVARRAEIGHDTYIIVDYNGTNGKLEQFANAIIKECAKVCEDRGTEHDQLYAAWAADCANRIRQHFELK
jgi:hypothetical protein